MEYGICLKSVIALRSTPDHRSEMVSQLLFGELYRITIRESSWYKIQMVYDNYEGWIPQNQANLIEHDEFFRLEQAPCPVCLDLVQLIGRESRHDYLPILTGSSLPGIRDGKLTLAGEQFSFDGSLSLPGTLVPDNNMPDGESVRYHLRESAMLYLNAPYLWGGRSSFGLDCSGFVQMVFKLQHIQLHRDASQQAQQGEVVGLIFEARTGDLAFFDNEEGQISHVGMFLSNNSLIHCSGSVRIDPIDQEGIYNHDQQRYTHKLRLIKRVI
jgi:hypothetical protein